MGDAILGPGIMALSWIKRTMQKPSETRNVYLILLIIVLFILGGPAMLMAAALGAPWVCRSVGARQVVLSKIADTIPRLLDLWKHKVGGGVAGTVATMAPAAYITYVAVYGVLSIAFPHFVDVLTPVTVGRFDEAIPVAVQARDWYASTYSAERSIAFGHVVAAHAYIGISAFTGILVLIICGQDRDLVDRVRAVSIPGRIAGTGFVLFVAWVWCVLFLSGVEGAWSFGGHPRDPRASPLFPLLAAAFSFGSISVFVFAAATLKTALVGKPG
jgi:hypothetical protein